MGRPVATDPVKYRVVVKLRKAEFEALEVAVEADGMSTSEWLRRAIARQIVMEDMGREAAKGVEGRKRVITDAQWEMEKKMMLEDTYWKGEI